MKVEEWNRIAGVLTEVRIDEKSIICLKRDIPKGLDPIKVIEDFYSVVDLERTKLLKKTSARKANVPRTKYKTATLETGEPLGTVNNIRIYSDKIAAIYRAFPNVLTSRNVAEKMMKIYPDLRNSTLINRANAYVRYMRDNGIIKEKSTDGKLIVYVFINPPEGVEPAAQAETVDPDYWQKSAEIERKMKLQG